MKNSDTKRTDLSTASNRFFALALTLIVVFAGFSACDELITEVVEITIAGNPTAEFSVDIDSGCIPLTVKFTDLSTGPRDSWLWRFGDGDSSTDTFPTHVYDSGGSYTVTLTVKDAATEGSDFEVKKRFIIVGASVLGFTNSIDSGCTGLTVSFTPELSGVTSWTWTFGDGGTSTDTFPSHTYNIPGVWPVMLKASGDCGTDSLIDTIIVSDCPTADFVSDIQTVCRGDTVIFFDASAPEAGEDIITRLWDFGDGNIISDPNNQYKYAYSDAGTFTVRLTVTSSSGATDTDSLVDYIVVHDTTKAGFQALSATVSCISDYQQFQVKFQDTSIGNIFGRVWDFGDGILDSSNNASPVHAYMNPGVYSVTLTVTGSCDTNPTTLATTQADLVVLSDTLGSVTFTKFPFPNNEFAFIGGATGVPNRWLWDFGDGQSTDSAKNVSHTYASSPSYYQVTLTVSNDCGPDAVKLDSVLVP